MTEEELVERAREAAYVAVGVGILGAQRLAVERRELARRARPQLREAAQRLQAVVAAADGAVNPVLDRFQERLPDATAEVVRSARRAATVARDAALARAAGRG